MYPKLIAPFDVIPFAIMTKRESQRYFDWFVSEVFNRINILASYYELTGGGTKEDLNLSQESLINLWTWFIQRIKMVPKTTEELEEEIDAAPEWLRQEFAGKTQKFSDETSLLIIDIGIYFGATFLNTFSNLHWGVIHKPTSYVDVNQPVITGFKNSELNPITIVYNSALKEARKETNENRLYDLFNTWKGFL